MKDHQNKQKNLVDLCGYYFICAQTFFVDKKLNSYIRRKKYESVQVHETKYYGAI